MISSLVCVLASTVVAAAPPPETTRDAVTDNLHGVDIVDDYRWLEALESENPDVATWTTAQNDYTRAILDNLPMRADFEKRIGELMTIGQVSPPQMRGNLYFNTERKGTENQSILYVREGADGQPRVLIDPNTLDERGLYSLDWSVPSEDGTLLAFGLSHAGDEMTVLHVLNVATGEWLADEISGKVDFGGWLPDNSGFLYGLLTNPDDAYSRTWRMHTLGRHQRHDPTILVQDDPSRIPGAILSRDGKWIVIEIFEGWAKQDMFVVNTAKWLNEGETSHTPIAFGLDARFAPQFIEGDTLYFFTTLDAPNGAIYSVNLNHPERENWKLVIPEREDAVLQGIRQAKDLIIAEYEKDAASRIEAFSMAGESRGEIDLPGAGIGSAGIVTRHDRSEAFLTFTSFNEPNSIYHFDLASPQRMALWARPEVPVDPSTVVVKQEFYTSKDGTKVPMFIIHRSDLELNGANPTILYGYGGFNISLTPSFSATRFPWYESGGVYAVANLRGGSEYGEDWHRAGMLESKQNVFDDFLAAAEYLIDQGYTSPEHLGILGGSNGGLLTGAAVTQRPDLFAAAISAVPLLDMLRYHNFLMAKFWVPEYGSADDPAQFSWLREYSPYHNIKPGQTYPSILFTAGENDNRVHPLHARKMAAKMQQVAGNDFNEDPILLWVDREAGHGAGKPLHLRIRDVADQHMFFAWQLGMLEKYLGADEAD